MKVVWSKTARKDLEDIYNYYVLKNPIAATKLHNTILNDIELLTTQPYIASKEPLFEGEKYIFRSLVTNAGLHKIIYFVDNDTLFIYRIWNCRMDTKSLIVTKG